jgi:acrylyl-CoA reductase (NADPH)
VRVEYSTLNYKDALAITGAAPVVRTFPLVPGIDLAGTVEESTDPRYRCGDAVLLNGWGVGEVHWGGLAELARVKGDWLLPVPDGLTARRAMAIGTAGYTAMLCILQLERHGITPSSGEVLVTGAAGGVGSIAVAILAELGFSVVAVSGRPETADFLMSLGASQVLPRDALSEPGKALAKPRWAGAIDVVGGHTLANVCASMRYRGVIAACGRAGSMDFPASVAPFILRGITLAGVDSTMCPVPERREAWARLARNLPSNKLDRITREIPLGAVVGAASEILAGAIQGRLVVAVSPAQ